MPQLKWKAEYDGDISTGNSIGRCPRCNCNLFQVLKRKTSAGNKRLRYNTYVVRCANEGHHKRHFVLPDFSSKK